MNEIQVTGPKVSFTIPLFGGIRITETVILQWFVMIIIVATCIILTRGMKKKPGKRQVLAEMLVNFFNKMVKDNMGSRAVKFYAPYLCSLLMFILLGSLISLLGLRTMTADINVTMTWALMTFALITYTKFKLNGFLGYFKTYAEPVAVMTPMNIISEAATPISMGFRLFGNMAGGMIITMLIYYGLGSLSRLIHIDIPIFTIGIPAVLSVYFDLFTSVIQSYVFIMLTMAYIGRPYAEDN